VAAGEAADADPEALPALQPARPAIAKAKHTHITELSFNDIEM